MSTRRPDQREVRGRRRRLPRSQAASCHSRFHIAGRSRERRLKPHLGVVRVLDIDRRGIDPEEVRPPQHRPGGAVLGDQTRMRSPGNRRGDCLGRGLHLLRTGGPVDRERLEPRNQRQQLSAGLFSGRALPLGANRIQNADQHISVDLVLRGGRGERQRRSLHAGRARTTMHQPRVHFRWKCPRVDHRDRPPVTGLRPSAIRRSPSPRPHIRSRSRRTLRRPRRPLRPPGCSPPACWCRGR
ncbi:hypothetical protein C1Y40_04792 [Mycobacterium talmoniae]|uniref:Uncharacterized protein n=1 Tax=Mycobacterium talmoniae TaxID=1858794 RepID=A0A2S8BEH3_9MYCO|nr:hypothetical protein C1Y40_04792 [Mycobacterium talmoniae]